ncbi:MAG TPA: ectonucleotide pyrophosphatase/phosphodiesterase [Tenuifilaceae bacterium]|nr:ectonucleotide pyrophosphatase/phosphodiesterase [Tenuifilaceae bacterium]
MKKKLKVILLTVSCMAIALGISASNPQNVKGHPEEYVLLISFDGFRWDYPTMYHTPNLDLIGIEGVHAKSLISCYPSKTFPNHYSLATGLYPDHHGIVNNSFFDKKLGYYSIGNRKSVENGEFYQGELIWVTAEKQGVRTASYYWVGTEAPIQGIQPTYWKPYNERITFEQRVDTVLHWLSLPEGKRPHLITFYYHEPDLVSHNFGPSSPQTKKVVEQLDSLLGYFMLKLKLLPIYPKINVIVVSDHGMAEISSDRYINLSEHLKKEWFEYISGGNPVYSLQPKIEHYAQVMDSLKKILHLNVWERGQIPSRYSYGTNPRVNDILIEAEAGWSVGWSSKADDYNGGTHGYDNMLPDMQGIFYAIGPAFKHGYSCASFMNVDVYPLIAHILELNPAKTDGKLKEVKNMLRQ